MVNFMTWKNDIEENFKFGLIDIMILKLLSKEPMYGYQIKQTIDAKSNNLIEMKEGSLYGPFYRLEKKNYITSNKVLVGQKRFRVYYQITDIGREYLEQAISSFKTVYDGAKRILLEEDDTNE